MGSRNVLTLLIVVFVAVLLYNALYFTGVVGGFGTPQTAQPLPRDDRFDVPGMERREAPVPRPSGVQPQPAAAAAAPARRAVRVADLSVGTNWGRNPFLTPQEIWALANFRPIYYTQPSIPEGGLYLSAIVMDSTGRRVAIINGDPVSVGDFVGGMQVVEMWDDAVVFRLEGQRHVIRMADQAIQLSVRGGAGR